MRVDLSPETLWVSTLCGIKSQAVETQKVQRKQLSAHMIVNERYRDIPPATAGRSVGSFRIGYFCTFTIGTFADAATRGLLSSRLEDAQPEPRPPHNQVASEECQ